jgi:hypothetical protein
MKKTAARIAAVVPIAFLGWALFSLLTAPAEPPGDWRLHMTQEAHDVAVAPIDHAYRVAAYAVTWAIQLGYLAWLGLKWQSQERDGERPAANSHSN